MAIVSFNNIATIGLVKDIGSENLPSDDKSGFAWTDSQNVRFKNNAIQKMPGYSTIIDTGSTIAPYYSVRINTGSTSYYVYLGLNKAYTLHSGSHYNITRQSTGVDVNYTASVNNPWTHTVLNGLPVFNNGFDAPQAWTNIGTGNRLSNLSNWPTNFTCAVMRSYKAYLIALDITDAVPSRNPNKIKWSAAALPGALPTSWDFTDPTNDAGEQQLSDSDGYLVDCLPLNDFNVIYKNTSTYLMSYVGGNEIFSIKKVFPNVGMLSKNCAAAFNGKHFVVTNDDVIVHDGYNYQSIIDGKNKLYLFNNINTESYKTTFVVPNYAQGEMWICFPTGSSTYPNMALIYNYNNNTWTKRVLPETSHIIEGFIDITSSPAWSAMSSTTWANADFPWDQTIYNTTAWSLSMAVPSQNKIFLIDKTDTTENGTPATCYLERENILLSPDTDIKMIKRVWPKMTLLSGANSVVNIHIGTSMVRGSTTAWQGPYAFNINTDNKIDCFATGRYLSIRFSSSTDVSWKLDSFDIDVIPKGKF
jgi:hypothetical protein